MSIPKTEINNIYETQYRLDRAAISLAKNINKNLVSGFKEMKHHLESNDYSNSIIGIHKSSYSLLYSALTANESFLNVDNAAVAKSVNTQLFAEHNDLVKSLAAPSPIVAINNARASYLPFVRHVSAIKSDLRQWINMADYRFTEQQELAQRKSSFQQRMEDSN